MKKTILLLFAGLSIFMSCSSDLEVIGDYEDYTIVYGILNENDSIHKFKITKAFLGEISGYEMALEEDSNYYKYNEIDAYLEEWNNSNLLNTIKLDTGYIRNKEAGTFYAPNQMVYENKDPFHLNGEYKYKLRIENHKSNKTISTELNIISGGTISSPYDNQGNRTYDMTQQNQNVSVWGFENASICYAKVRFYYVESKDGELTQHYFDWQLGSKKQVDGEVDISYSPNSIYDEIKRNLEVDESIERYPGTINLHEYQLVYTIRALDENYYTYKELSSNDDNVFTISTEYSNIDNGFGIVYSAKEIGNNFAFSPDALDELINGVRTRDLNFHDW